MKNNETGEFELVLGNRQLLSGFFVVVILFAVFFVMGYIVGRNSSPPSRTAATTDQSGAAGAVASEARPQPATGAIDTPPSSQPAATEPAPKETKAEPQPTTQPAQPAQQKTADAPASATPAPVEPAPGETYLQVMSVKQADAEVVSRSLKDKGFPALLAPGPPGRTRVLVGPYSDTASLGKAKAELENAGFHPIVKK